MVKKAVTLLLLGSLYCVLSLVHASHFPAGITKCNLEDEKCLMEGVNYVLKNHASTGVKELALVPLDPLRIKKFSLGKNPNSPVNIDLVFTDAELLGLGTAMVKKISPFTRDLKSDITFELIAPKLTLKGLYKVNGRVLILPIHGAGNAVIVLENCKVRAAIKVHPVPKGEKQTFVEAQDVKLRLDPSHVSYKFEGLFNGEKAPSDAFHTLVNENWKEIFNELQADISTATGLIFKAILNRSLGKLPVEQLFNNF